MALASTASAATAWTGLDHLLKFYRTQVFDAALGLPRPWQYADLAQYCVIQACPSLPMAICLLACLVSEVRQRTWACRPSHA